MAPSAPSPSMSPAMPKHVAIIMDGNGRWAKQRHLPRALGHREGAEAVRRTVQAAGEMGIGYLTLYAFSSENWKRPIPEIDDLMSLLRFYLNSEVKALHSNNVQIHFIGSRERLSPDVLKLVDEAAALTAGNQGLKLIIALNYGARDELVRAVQAVVQEIASGALSLEAIDEGVISRNLYTAGFPDPDLIVRTSGEQRLSNFLLWQAAYAELVFTQTLWPDFNHAALQEAIGAYHARERRYGGRIDADES